MQHFKLELHLNSRREDVESLISRCKNGESSAQRELYRQLAPKMFAVCLRYMGDRDAAEDVLQDGFVTLFTKLDNYSGDGSFEGWARKIFVNTALMSLRKNDVLRDSFEVETIQDTGIDNAPSALQQIGYKELMLLVESLPVGFRTVFNMYVVEGYSHKEIADNLGISENTSRSQLQRARMILQKKILERNQDVRRR